MAPKSMEELMHYLIQHRKLLVAGKDSLPDSSNGTKVKFHFKTEALYKNKTSTTEHKNEDKSCYKNVSTELCNISEKESNEKNNKQKSCNDSQNSCCNSSSQTSSQKDQSISNEKKKDASKNHDEVDLFDSEGPSYRTITVDDSKALNCKPMELFYGHQFKFQFWEEWLKNMRIGECSQICLDWKLCEHVYPLLSKSYRNFCSPPSRIYENETTRARRANHCCGMQNSTHKASLGYEDLDCLVEHPPDMLQFTLELLSVELPAKTDKEVWLMNDNDMISTLPELRTEASALFSKKDYKNAAEKYRKALAILEQLQMKEKPNDTEWNELEKQKIPFLSNLAQCELFLEQYYEALEHSNEAYQKDSGNVKALFRRAKANLAVWNFDEAKSDFFTVRKLDPSLDELVKQQLNILEQKEKNKKAQDELRFKGKLFG